MQHDCRGQRHVAGTCHGVQASTFEKGVQSKAGDAQEEGSLVGAISNAMGLALHPQRNEHTHHHGHQRPDVALSQDFGGQVQQHERRYGHVHQSIQQSERSLVPGQCAVGHRPYDQGRQCREQVDHAENLTSRATRARLPTLV